MRKKILSILMIGVFLLVLLFLMTGCPQHNDSLYGAKVTGDGDGGAIAVYEDVSGGNIYAQKISAEGKTVWGEKGVLLGNTGSQSYTFSNTQVINGAAGGAIVSWYSYAPKALSPEYHVTKLDTDGKTRWQQDFSRVDQLISDGNGGAIIGYTDADGLKLYLNSIDANGNETNPIGNKIAPGVSNNGNLQEWQMVSDNAGGAIIAWVESQYPAGKQPGESQAVNHICVQRIDDKGSLLWGDISGDGTSIYSPPEGSWVQSLQVTDDGTGGAILSWFQSTEIINKGNNSPKTQNWDIFTQKIDGSGNILWQPDGVSLKISETDKQAAPSNPVITSDNSGGAIIAWRDSRDSSANSASVYAQRLDADGNLKWDAGGIKVAMTSVNPRPLIISGDLGGAITVYSSQEDGRILNAQKLDSNGQTLFPQNGITITGDGFVGDSIVSDGQGGMIAAWGVNSNGAYVQKLSANGQLLWGQNGIKLNQ
jgi:hypothetical protein